MSTMTTLARRAQSWTFDTDSTIGWWLTSPRGQFAWKLSSLSERLAKLSHRICDDCPDYEAIRADAVDLALYSASRPAGGFDVETASRLTGRSTFEIRCAINAGALESRMHGGRLTVTRGSLADWIVAGRPVPAKAVAS